MLQITVSESQVRQLESWVKSGNTPQGIALRSMIILETHRGESAQAIGQTRKVSQPTSRLWKRRFMEGGPQALPSIAPGRGRKRQISRQKVSALVAATQQTKPAGQTHWSCRTMAKAKGVSFKTVQRIWNLHGLKPHPQRTFKLSRDKRFVEKRTDVVGVYLNPPDKAVVLCVDEKEPDPGARPHPARPAAQEGALRHAHS